MITPAKHTSEGIANAKNCIMFLVMRARRAGGGGAKGGGGTEKGLVNLYVL